MGDANSKRIDGAGRDAKSVESTNCKGRLQRCRKNRRFGCGATTLKRSLVIGFLVFVAFAAGIAVTAWILDVHEDREYTVMVTGKVPVYDSESPPAYKRGDEGVIDILRPPDQVKVLRITNHTDSQAIKVLLHDGREGYIFCCENFEINK